MNKNMISVLEMFCPFISRGREFVMGNYILTKISPGQPNSA